jgi:hypothetical protein
MNQMNNYNPQMDDMQMGNMQQQMGNMQMNNMQQQMGGMHQQMGNMPLKGTPISAIRKDIPQVKHDDTDYNSIRHLVDDINKELDEYKPSRDTQESPEEIEIRKPTPLKKKKKKRDVIPDILKEPLLLLLIYVIMSQEFVKNLIGSYITIINPTDDGNVSFIGVVMYGVILTIFFIVLRSLLL